VLDGRLAVAAARRFVVSGRRVVDAEDVVEEIPHASLGSVSRFALSDVQQHDPRPIDRRRLRHRREGGPAAAIQMKATDNWLKWA
jgi:hypothetical protein